MAVEMMLTSKGQFTFNKALMEHLGIKAGEKVLIEKRIDGTLSVKPAKNRVSAKSLIGLLKTDIHLSDDELNEAIKQSYVQRGIKGME